jgi:hypothetical protein
MSRHFLFLCATVACASLLLCSCDVAKASGVINTVEAVLNGLLQDKNFIEQAAREIKRGYAPDAPTYAEVSGLYSQARSAHEAYLQALIATANVGGVTPALAALADSDQKNAALFLQAAAQALSRGERGVPDLSKSRLLTSSPSPPWGSNGLSKAQKLAAARTIDRNAKWRTWDAL